MNWSARIEHREQCPFVARPLFAGRLSRKGKLQPTRAAQQMHLGWRLERNMRKLAILIAALFGLGLSTSMVQAQDPTKKPKSEEAKIRKARKEDPTTRQVTVDPKKSPDKHTKNLSKNVNHEANRSSKRLNHMF